MSANTVCWMYSEVALGIMLFGFRDLLGDLEDGGLELRAGWLLFGELF
jgi:hypothetical protein